MTGEEGWLPGQVPDGWKRYYFVPSGTAVLGGLFGALVHVALRRSAGAAFLQELVSPRASCLVTLGMAMGVFLGLGFTVVMFFALSQDRARRRCLAWGETSFAASAGTAFLTFELLGTGGTIYLP